MDASTYRHFAAHIRELERRAISGDLDAVKSIGCMALLIHDPDPPTDGGEDGNVIKLDVFKSYLRAA